MKAKRLKKGDRVAIVSLSNGMLGEDSSKFYLEIANERLKAMGLEPVFMPNTLKGIKILGENPNLRADDLKCAFKDKSIKAIMCAIGGEDTCFTLQYLLTDEEFIEDVKNNPKIFLGFSDSTVNHLMFYKLGLNTFYGQAYITEFAELSNEMLDYSREKFIAY